MSYLYSRRRARRLLSAIAAKLDEIPSWSVADRDTIPEAIGNGSKPCARPLILAQNYCARITSSRTRY